MIEIQTRDARGLPTLAEADDAALVQGVLNGQRELFAVLMRRHNGRVFRIARGITRDDADAQDAVQGAFVSAYRGLAGFRAEARFSTWLSRIVVREAQARAIQRKRAAARASDADTDLLVSSTLSPEAHIQWARLRGVLETLVDGLPAPQRLVFMMRDVQELSTLETAEALQISEEAVRVRLFRARQLLRQEIEASLDVPVTDLFRFDGSRCDRIVAEVWRILAEDPPPGSG